MTRALLDQVALAIRDGRLDAAEETLAPLAQSHPDDVNVLNFLGLIAAARGDHPSAVGHFERAIGAAPGVASLAMHLGNARHALGEYAAAATAFGEALAARPDWSDAAYNLGHAWRQAHRYADAGRAFLHAARQDPMNFEAASHAIGMASTAVRFTEDPCPRWPTVADREPGAKVSVIVCSIDPAKLQRLRASLEPLLAGSPWELIHIADAQSLCEGYNRGMARATGEYLVLCHDDIEVLAPDFRGRLIHHLQTFDIIGVAGATRLDGPAVFWSGTPYVHGWVTHMQPDGSLMPSISSAEGPVIANAQALDGLFMAGRAAAVRAVGFDQRTFDGWHFYDLDFSFRAAQAGLSVGICQDLLVVHHSRGDFDQAYWRYAEAFCAKFPGMPHRTISKSLVLFQMPASDRDETRAVYAYLMDWLARADEPLPAV